MWADGLYVKAGLEDTKAALLGMRGALTDGRKVVLAVERGQREAKEWRGMLWRNLSTRGRQAWRCTSAAGALGLGAAVGEHYPELAEHRGWNHQLVNVLAALPTKHQATASAPLRARSYAESQAACAARRDQFTARYQALAPKAGERLHDDWERLVTFYQFPQEPWVPLRPTNIVESPFATGRLRTTAAKRFKKVEKGTALSGKLLPVAAAAFRRLKGAALLPAV